MEARSLVYRVRLRYLPGEHVPGDDEIEEMLQTVIDRIRIRMETTAELPETASSIVVDAAMKALRLRGYEGSTSESAGDGGSVSNSFVDDILSAYADDLDSMRKALHGGGIKFLRG